MEVHLTEAAIKRAWEILDEWPEMIININEYCDAWTEEYPGATIELSQSEEETERIVAQMKEQGLTLVDSNCCGSGDIQVEFLCFFESRSR